MTVSARPQWIARMHAAKPGRDHLGLGSVSSGQILVSLSPSINVLTFHPRYHSFYVFLLDEFWRRDFPRSRESWKGFFRPRDFVYSLGVNLCENPEHGEMRNVVGAEKTGPMARDHSPSYSYDPDYIESHFGGYGLYYRTVMAELGLIFPGGQGFPYPVDVPSEDGKQVAEAFRRSIRDTRYYLEFFEAQSEDIPTEVIKEYIDKACLCQLQKDNAPDRTFLRDTFLHRGTTGQARARRETFRMFLDIADQTQLKSINEDDFRQLLYFGETAGGITYSPSAVVIDTYSRWRLYQAREYYSFALNALWYHLCDWGIQRKADFHPLPLRGFWEYVAQGLDFEKLARRLRLPEPQLRNDSHFTEVSDWIESVVGKENRRFDQACNIRSPIHEHLLYQLALDNRSEPDVMIAGMIVLLALVAMRFGDSLLSHQPEWEIARMGADVRLSMDLFLKKLAKKTKTTGASIFEVARWLYEHDVILQHELVATSKLPENTFRFQRDGDYLRFQNLNNNLTFMSSRFDAIATTVYELGLSGNLGAPNHKLTEGGMQLLQAGDL